RPPRDPRFDRMALAIVRNPLVELLDELRSLGSRANETHFPSQHVENLRQLIDAGEPNECTDLRHTAVVLLGPLRLTIAFGVLTHAAKLQQLERPPVLADTDLSVKDRSARSLGELDRERRKHHERQREREQDERGEHVEDSL